MSITCRYFNWAEQKSFEVKEKYWFFGWKEVTSTVKEYLYKIPQALVDDALKFASSLDPDQLISISGGDRFRSVDLGSDRAGCVIVWYREKESSGKSVG